MRNQEYASNLVQDVITRLATRNNSVAGDYYDDEGYLVCHCCGTRKQTDIVLVGTKVRVPVLCQCEKQAEAEAAAKKAQQDAEERVRRLQEQGMTDRKYLRWRFELDDRANQKVSDATRRYAEKWMEMQEKNIGILFYGDVGTGKTFFAACIANYLIEHGVSVLMSNIPGLMAAMSRDFERDKGKILANIASVPLLVLDDLGIERGTTYGNEKLQEMIDARYRSGHPLIVTTNLAPSELKNPTDIRYKRTYDRILEMCYPIHVDGENRRATKARTMREDAGILLGI